MFIGVKLCAGFVMLVISVTSFAKLTINLVDANGRPVPNAVVSLASKHIEPATDTHFPTVIMDQVDYQFVPKVLIVNKNQKVDFPNSDNVRHHVYSFSQPKTFEIRMYQGSEAKPVDFDRQGIVVLGCNIHDSMVGYIYVADQEHAYLSNALGRVTLPSEVMAKVDIQSKPFTVHVWHPQLSSTHIEREVHSIDTHQSEVSISLNIQQDNADSQLPTPAKSHNKFDRGIK